jgi:hypothetical protein
MADDRLQQPLKKSNNILCACLSTPHSAFVQYFEKYHLKNIVSHSAQYPHVCAYSKTLDSTVVGQNNSTQRIVGKSRQIYFKTATTENGSVAK